MAEKKFGGILIILVPHIVERIVKEYGVDDEKATEMLYESKLYASLEDEQTKLWHLSAPALFDLFVEEQQTGHITFPEEV
jgi:hypothetical protein